MTDNVERFTNRVANYVKFRPGYPPSVLELLKTEMGLTPRSVLADVGSGPGISSTLFVEFGCTVYGVEPNAAMRCAAEELMREYPNFRSVSGTAEATGLANGSCDIVMAAQAFHWFEPETAGREFRRILRPGGYAALLWNERRLDADAFHREYEAVLLKFARDYTAVRHDKIDEAELLRFFGKDFRKATYPNSQEFDLEGLVGRASSASYMPAEGDPEFAGLYAELSDLFAKHSENDKIVISYDTNVFFTQIT
jgi:SAM-dependent methyltransferase